MLRLPGWGEQGEPRPHSCSVFSLLWLQSYRQSALLAMCLQLCVSISLSRACEQVVSFVGFLKFAFCFPSQL